MLRILAGFLEGSETFHGQDVQSQISQCGPDGEIFQYRGIISISQRSEIRRHDLDGDESEKGTDDPSNQLPRRIFDD